MITIFNILYSAGLLKFSGKKYSLALHLVKMDPDPDPAADLEPDRQVLDAGSDPEK